MPNDAVPAMLALADADAITSVVLEDTDRIFKSLDGKIRRMCDNLGLEPSVRHCRTWDKFAELVSKLRGTRAFLIFCDIEDREGETVRKMHEYVEHIWNESADTWIQHRPVIVYSRNDDTISLMKRAARRNRRHASAVISQTIIAGTDPLEDLRHALADAIEACRDE